MALVLGVDSSTQSTKVEMRDADTGELIGSGRASHPATFPPRSEQDPASSPVSASRISTFVDWVEESTPRTSATSLPGRPGFATATVKHVSRHGFVAV